MHRRTLGFLVIAAVVALAGLAVAGDVAAPVTVEGKLLCAKCTLAEEGQDKCQSVVVAGEQKYYLIKNAVAEKDGHVCKGEKAVKVTGVVSEKDGRKWIEATEIAEIKS
jgi:hypothetical protein